MQFPETAGLLVTFPESRGRHIDDIISFTGKLSLPFNNEIFDYRTYLLLDDVYATTSVSFPEKIGIEPSSPFTLFVRNMKDAILTSIEQIYPGESAKLLE